ncbi:MAG: 2-C-methyl-D-erythritol 4-phosphate cytidylyltransferase [Bacteroidales bacterium]
MSKKLFLIVMAAGSGSRMGTDLPKQFLDLCGEPVLRRTIEKFTSAINGITVITVLPEKYLSYWKDYCLCSRFNCPQLLVAGGITRFHSVRNALERVPDGAIVAIHDGVRPLVSEELIRNMFAAMENHRALVPVLQSVDTLISLRKTVAPDGSQRLEKAGSEVIDREAVYRVQTPQMFLSEDIKTAYSAPYDISFTDDSSVAAKMNIPVSFIEGDRYNVKITTPEDLAFAKLMFEA